MIRVTNYITGSQFIARSVRLNWLYCAARWSGRAGVAIRLMSTIESLHCRA